MSHHAPPVSKIQNMDTNLQQKINIYLLKVKLAHLSCVFACNKMIHALRKGDSALLMETLQGEYNHLINEMVELEESHPFHDLITTDEKDKFVNDIIKNISQKKIKIKTFALQGNELSFETYLDGSSQNVTESINVTLYAIEKWLTERGYLYFGSWIRLNDKPSIEMECLYTLQEFFNPSNHEIFLWDIFEEFLNEGEYAY